MSKESETKKKAKKAVKAKPAAKKAPAKKQVTAKKTIAPKKPAVKKVAAKKPAAKNAPAKKPAAAAKKATTKKVATKKPAVKKVAAKKPAIKKAPAKKPVVKKVAPKKKVAAKKAPARKSAPVSKAPMPKAPAPKAPSASMNQASSSSNDDASSFTKMLVIIATVVAIVSLYFLLAAPADKPAPREVAAHKSEAHKPSIGGVFELVDADGNVFKSEYLQGKPSIVYFGFTYCPNICPTQLNKMTEVINVLDKYQIDVTPVFITLDPERDDTKMLKSYMGSFHPKFVALTGTSEQVKQATDGYKVYFETDPGSDSGNNDYQINHSSFIYLIDKDGNYLKHFDIEMSPEEIVEYIRINLK